MAKFVTLRLRIDPILIYHYCLDHMALCFLKDEYQLSPLGHVFALRWKRVCPRYKAGIASGLVAIYSGMS